MATGEGGEQITGEGEKAAAETILSEPFRCRSMKIYYKCRKKIKIDVYLVILVRAELTIPCACRKIHGRFHLLLLLLAFVGLDFLLELHQWQFISYNSDSCELLASWFYVKRSAKEKKKFVVLQLQI